MNAIGLTIADRVYEMRQRLMASLLQRDWTTDHLDGAMDRFFWFESDIEAFRRSNHSPVTLTLNGLDRLARCLELPLHSFLRELDGDDRPLPITLLRPTEHFDIASHLGRRLHAARSTQNKTAGWVVRPIPGMTAQDLKGIERGEFEPSVMDLMMLGDRLGLTFADLIGDLSEGVEIGTEELPPPPIALGEADSGPLVVRLWYDPDRAGDPTAWAIQVMRRTGRALSMPAQDEFSDEDWAAIRQLADRVLTTARARLPHLNLPNARFSGTPSG